MNAQPKEELFAHRHLDPASRMGEILFGLIMVLTITLTAGLTVREGKEGVRDLLIAALGCNIAWGFIDGVMYVLNCMAERSVKGRLIQAIQNAPSPSVALDIIRDEVEPELESLAPPEAREVLYRSMLEYLPRGVALKTTLKKDDLLGGLACFLLVFASLLDLFRTDPGAARL